MKKFASKIKNLLLKSKILRQLIGYHNNRIHFADDSARTTQLLNL